jgi:hypothetical protein
MAPYWMARAVMAIDVKFGEGHAKANPALVAAIVTAVAMTEAAALITASIDAMTATPAEEELLDD